MTRLRIITALALLAVLLPSTFFAPQNFLGALLLGILTIAVWEWARLLKIPRQFACLYCLVFAFLNAGFFLYSGPNHETWLFALCLVAVTFWLSYAPWALWKGVRALDQCERIFLLLAGLPVLSAAWLALMVLHAEGAGYMLSVLVTVWLADSGAYFFGKGYGRHKLAAHISPGKTIEGALGGLFCVLLIFAFTAWWGKIEPTFLGVILTLHGLAWALCTVSVLVAASILGDLFESLLKRRAGVKDSGYFLPGHGGVLDRIDALLPTLPLALLIHSCVI